MNNADDKKDKKDKEDKKEDSALRFWGKILVAPIVLAVLSGYIAHIADESHRLSEELAANESLKFQYYQLEKAERDANASLTLQYTQFFLANLKDINDTDVRSVMSSTAGLMQYLDLPGGDAFSKIVHGHDQIDSQVENKNITNITDYRLQNSSGNCTVKPGETDCIPFADGFALNISNDSVVGWDSVKKDNKTVQVAIGLNRTYYHILDTKFVKQLQ